uniref:Uncharacterized protein LOC110208883 isoform X5 n=1 Tax=Phascolarctos cinereus TaxID=38626 RepID=A0A6P5KBA1_PHACI|nr:uncharacterized protein LOC110208883 isoform X5 [Phascolarctos cinereus]
MDQPGGQCHWTEDYLSGSSCHRTAYTPQYFAYMSTMRRFRSPVRRYFWNLWDPAVVVTWMRSQEVCITSLLLRLDRPFAKILVLILYNVSFKKIQRRKSCRHTPLKCSLSLD